jgi:hypothetical protein
MKPAIEGGGGSFGSLATPGTNKPPAERPAVCHVMAIDSGAWTRKEDRLFVRLLGTAFSQPGGPSVSSSSGSGSAGMQSAKVPSRRFARVLGAAASSASLARKLRMRSTLNASQRLRNSRLTRLYGAPG